MEYPLGDAADYVLRYYCHVLILLLLEYPLGRLPTAVLKPSLMGLNPSFSGIPARAKASLLKGCKQVRLNPSSTGITSRARGKGIDLRDILQVLILLFMPPSLARKQVRHCRGSRHVIILLLMEHPLGHTKYTGFKNTEKS